ncbi:hypothetical protein [Elioraea sp.]|uniref:hypothetical protein n=1 Tax=Elioraea sp. TaxID=2185103 RepID=UPI0025BC96FF|nr:hypothetical protein [Elioraea sp.]
MTDPRPRLAVAGGHPAQLTPAAMAALLGLDQPTTLRALHQALRDEDPASWAAEPQADPLAFAAALLKLIGRPGGIASYARASARAEDEALPGALRLDLFDACRFSLFAALRKAAPESAASLLRRAQAPLPPALPLAEAGVAAELWAETALLVWAMGCGPRGLAPEAHAMMEEHEGLADALAGIRWRPAGAVPAALTLPMAEEQEAVFGFAESSEPLLPPSLAAAATPSDPVVARVASLPDHLRAPLPSGWEEALGRAEAASRAAVDAAAGAVERASLDQDEAETALREAALREVLDHDVLFRLLEAAKARAGAGSRAAAALAQAVSAAIADVPAPTSSVTER